MKAKEAESQELQERLRKEKKALVDTINSLQTRMLNFEGVVKDLKSDFDAKQSRSSESRQKLEGELKAASQVLEQTQSELKERMDQLEDATKELQSKQAELDEAKLSLTETEKMMELLEGRLLAANTKINALESKVEAANSRSGNAIPEPCKDCETKSSDFADLRERFAGQAKSIDTLEIERDSLQQEVNALKAELAVCISRAEEFRDKMNFLDESLGDARKCLAAEITKRQELLETFESRLQEAETVKVDLEDKLANVHSELAAKILEADMLKDKLRSYILEKEKQKSQISSLQSQVGSSEESMEDLQRRLEDVLNVKKSLEVETMKLRELVADQEEVIQMSRDELKQSHNLLNAKKTDDVTQGADLSLDTHSTHTHMKEVNIDDMTPTTAVNSPSLQQPKILDDTPLKSKSDVVHLNLVEKGNY
jgi:chromosome segregation ATPase